MKEQYLAHLEKNLSQKEWIWPVLEYEAEDGAQLDFYATDYLEERPSPGTSSAFMLFMGSDKQPGRNGFHSRKCILKPVEKISTAVWILNCFHGIGKYRKKSLRFSSRVKLYGG